MTDTFKLDTSGIVRVNTPFVGRDPDSLTRDRSVMVGGPVQWGNLSPFTQGYIEALFNSERASDVSRADWISDTEGGGAPGACTLPCDAGFSDLAPETLARIIADCEAAAPRYVIPGYPGGPESGRLFWIDRQSPEHIHGFPPLTVTLGDDGKVRFA